MVVPNSADAARTTRRNLSTAQAKAYYDRLGGKQDWQFYERRAEETLLTLGGFDDAAAVFEMGCGTGALALRLLRDYLPANAHYLGIDLSDTMVSLAHHRLNPFAPRARVERTDGAMRFPTDDGTFDRFLSAYVFDLLPPELIAAALTEAGRILRPGSLLCLIGLTFGTSLTSRLVTRARDGLHRLNPSMVGGCRPISLKDFLSPEMWQVVHHEVVVSFAVPSDVVICRKP